MKNAQNTTNTKKARTPKTQEEKVMKKNTSKKAVETVETPVIEEVKETPVTVVDNKEKKPVSLIQVMDNDTLKKLFQDNGCLTRTNASNSSNVVYNTFGTQSRVLQQKRAYQLLLTNGHADKKGVVVDTENDDTARFIDWYNTLTDEQKGWVSGYESINATKLSASEMPRERTVKLTSYELLVQFIQYMATFDENKITV